MSAKRCVVRRLHAVRLPCTEKFSANILLKRFIRNQYKKPMTALFQPSVFCIVSFTLRCVHFYYTTFHFTLFTFSFFTSSLFTLTYYLLLPQSNIKRHHYAKAKCKHPCTNLRFIVAVHFWDKLNSHHI